MAHQQARVSPARPSIDLLGSSVSTGSGLALGLDEDPTRQDDDGETVESLMNKLAIERRVQYGAEKMLDVIEKRTGEGEQDQVRERITAQLEAANEHIKTLETKLERLRGGTPHRARRRPPPRLNGFSSNSSLTHQLSSSSSSALLANAGRPRYTRQGSSLTPDRERESYSVQGTPSKVMARVNTSSTLGSGSGGRGARGTQSSGGEDGYDLGSLDGDISGNGTGAFTGEESEDEHLVVIRETVAITLRRLQELARSAGNGKGKSPERGDEPWDCLTRLAEMFKKSPALCRYIDIDDVVHCTFPFLADGSTCRRRTAAYRLLRYILDRDAWGRILGAGIEWLVIRTFTRDAKSVLEREQALRLVRAVVTLPPPAPTPRQASPRRRARRDDSQSNSRGPPIVSTGPDPIDILLERRVPLTEGLVRALVSAAENPDDAMRTVCMQTLVEIALLDLPCLLRADAFRIILNAYKDGPYELGPGMTGVLLYLINQPSTRELLISGSDLETVLVGLTEEYGKVPTRQMQRHLDKLEHCVRNVSMLLGSWPGLIYLCMDDRRAIKSLISSLHVPITEMRNSLLDLFFSAFRIKTPSWTNAFLDGRRLTVYNRTHEATSSQLQENIEDDDLPQSVNLVDHYVSFLLAVFIEAGLIEALVDLIQEEHTARNLSRKATLLLGEILQMVNNVLPLQYAAQVQALPRLFQGVSEFSKPDERNAALSALSSIDSLNRNQRKPGQPIKRNRLAAHSIQESLQRGQRQVQQVKLRLGLQIDDKQFQLMINESGVLLGRDHTKWNFDIIMDLLQGPLLNPKRLDEVIKATKFFRRLFSFFQPLNNRFSSVIRTRPNHKWVRLACALLTTLLVNPEGIRALAEDKLLKQMADCLAELDQYAGQPSAQPIFARDRLENTLTYGYFEMIGTLSRHREGMKLLEKFKYFTYFYHLSELRSRDDIIKLIIECFDYSIDAHQRIVLSKALTSSYMESRLFATHHLGRLLHDDPELTDWALQLLITQLYDPAMEVCEIAVMYLEEACTDPVNLEKVVHLRPTLEHLGDIGANLFLRFMSTSAGFVYLHQAQYIDRELESWLTEHNLLYVIETETFVSKTVRPFSSDRIEDYWTYESTAPTHFFGELTKTPEGCQYLKEKGIISEFAEVIRLHGMETEDQAVLTNLKSVLWAMGNVGSTEGGLAFLEDEEIIETIIEIAEQSPVLTMKGTCFFVIGLISSTTMGAEILEEYGWIATRTSMGMTTGLCIPNDISRFAYIEPWERLDIKSSTPSLPAITGLESEVMHMISNLSNYVLAAGAMNNLKRVRNRHPRVFSSTTIFHRAMRSVSSNHFQAPVRRFILDLFDVELGPDTLPRLIHLERASYAMARGPKVPSDGVGDMDHKDSADDDCGSDDGCPRDNVDNNNLNLDHGKKREQSDEPEHEHERENRRRARSSPGPAPGPEATSPRPRARGLTVSELTPIPTHVEMRERRYGMQV